MYGTDDVGPDNIIYIVYVFCGDTTHHAYVRYMERALSFETIYFLRFLLRNRGGKEVQCINKAVQIIKGLAQASVQARIRQLSI